MIFIPYKCDAVAPRFPWGIVALIAANVLVAVILGFPAYAGFEEPAVNDWVLEFGRLQPMQWITSAFVHLGWIHLVGNMMFLLMFGFVVESYLGGRRFLILYFLLAVVQGCLTQPTDARSG